LPSLVLLGTAWHLYEFLPIAELAEPI